MQYRWDVDSAVTVLVFLIFLVLWYWRPRWRPDSTAHGTARWATDADLGRRVGPAGLAIGRSVETRRLINLKRYVHLSVFAPAGAGKSAGLAIPWLLTYPGNVVVLDVKGELYKATAHVRKRMGSRVVLLDPFGVCRDHTPTDSFNPLDLIGTGPGCVDDARALSEALVTRTGEEKDPYWNDQSANVLTAAITAACLFCKPEGRNLGGIRRILTDPGTLDPETKVRVPLLNSVAIALQDERGVFANLSGLVLALEKENRSGVLSTAMRHTTFLDSQAILGVTNTSTVDIRELLTGNVTLHLVLPPHQLEAQARWLKAVVSSIIRLIGQEGTGREILMLLDEAGQLGPMPAIEQGLTLLRSYGLRMVFMFQSLSQLKAVFKEKEGILLDNTEQIYFGIQSYETAERVSKMLGNYTRTVTSYSESQSRNWNEGQIGQPGVGVSVSSSLNTTVIPRALLTPDELLNLDPDLLIAFLRDTPPVIARRLKWWEECYLRELQTRK